MPAARCSRCDGVMNASTSASTGCSCPRCSIPEPRPIAGRGRTLNERLSRAIASFPVPEIQLLNSSLPSISQHADSEPSNIEVAAVIDGTVSGMNRFINEHRILTENLDVRITALDALRQKVNHFSSRLSDAVTELETFGKELHRQFSVTCKELKDSAVAQIAFEQEELANEFAKFVSEQAKLQSDQESLNQVFTEKLSALEILGDRVDSLASELQYQSANNADAIASLESTCNEKHHRLSMMVGELQGMVVQIASDQRGLYTKDSELTNELAQLRHEKEDFDEFFTTRVEALENLNSKFDELLAKFERQLAIDESAAETFHTIAFDKYKLLETTCIKLQSSLDQVSSDQKKLAEENTRLVSEQADLQNKMTKVEKEQSECSYSELRMTIIQKEKVWKKSEQQHDSVVNGQRELWCKLETMEQELRQERSAISEFGPKEITSDAVNLSNGRTSEESGVTSAEESYERLHKDLVSQRRVKDEDCLPEVNPRDVFYTIAIIAFLTNFLCFPVFGFIFRQLFD